jgi:hypothetical protein
MQKQDKKKVKKVKSKDLTESQILKLRPDFRFGGITMVDWFMVNKGAGFYGIRSGLRHADGVTKSPYHYEHTLGGENTKKRVLEHFNKWWRKAKGKKKNETI